MAYALLCAGGVLYACERKTPIVRFGASVLALLLVGYAIMVRHNAAAATLALACYVVKIHFPRLNIARSIIGGAVLVAALMTTQQMIERVALNASRSHLSQIAMLFDVAGIACGGADVDIPAAFKVPGYEPSALCRSYDPNQVDALFFFPASPLRTSLDDASLAALRRVWLDAIIEHPKLYAVHRSRAFMALLGLRDVPRPYVALTQPYMQPNPWGFTFEPTALSRTLDATVGVLADHGVFNGALWVALALALLTAVAIGRLSAPFEVALLASALMYVLPYFFLSLAPNYRFIYWSVLATSVAGVLLALRAIGPAPDYETADRDVISAVDGA
jgi:hypothetical protein